MTVTTQTRTKTRKRPAQSTVMPAPAVEREQSVETTTVAQPKQTTQTNLVFQVLLGAAACLALVAVVQQASTNTVDPTSVDAPPPAVFVQTD